MGKSKSSLKISKVNVTSPVVCATYNHKTVGFYLVESTIKEGDVSTKYQIYHHFQEFRDLHATLADEYKEDHVKNMLPQVPPKEITWFTDHTSPDFLDKRKKLLKQYMKELVQIPRMEKDQNVLSFLGYYKKGVREVSLLFDDDLGLRIQPNEKDDYKVSIMAFTRGKDKLPGMAEESGLIYMNDAISSVDGETTINKSFEEVKAMIALSGRPIILTFRGNPSKAPEKVIVEKEDRKKKESDDEESGSDSEDGGNKKNKNKKNNKKAPLAKKGKKPVVSSDDDDESDKDSDKDYNSEDDKKKKKRKGKEKSKPTKKPIKKKNSSSDESDNSDKDSDDESDSEDDKKKKKNKKTIPPPPKSKSRKSSSPPPLPIPKKKKGSDSSDTDSDSDSSPVKSKSKSIPIKKKDSDSDSSDDEVIVVKRGAGGRGRKQSSSAEKLAVNAAASSDSSDSDVDPSV